MKSNLGFNTPFKSFFSKKAFCQLQYQFQLLDKNINKDERETIRMNMEDEAYNELYISNEINLRLDVEVDSWDSEWPTKWVFKEVILSNISYLSENYIKQFHKSIEEKSIYGIQQKADFADHERKKMPLVEKRLEDLDYQINHDIKQALLNQYHLIQEYLNSFIVDSIDDNRRLNFKMNRTDIILLFELLQRHGKLEMCEKQRLGSLIDMLFNYQTDNSTEYKPIKESRKVLSDNKKGNKTFNQAYNRLKKLFHDEINFEPDPIG